MDRFYFYANPIPGIKEAKIFIEEFSGIGEVVEDQVRQNRLEAEKLGEWIKDNLTGECREIITAKLS